MKNLIMVIAIILSYLANLEATRYKKLKKRYHENKLLSINHYLEMTYARVYRTR
jgi:hypothetical protein